MGPAQSLTGTNEEVIVKKKGVVLLLAGLMLISCTSAHQGRGVLSSVGSSEFGVG
jgi:hypothetical protein